MTSTWYTCVMKKLRIAIQHWLRKLLGVMSTDEVELATMRAYRDARNDIERALNQLHNAEARINKRFQELERAESEITRVASQTTLAIYDLVEQSMAIKQTLDKERDIDKP